LLYSWSSQELELFKNMLNIVMNNKFEYKRIVGKARHDEDTDSWHLPDFDSVEPVANLRITASEGQKARVPKHGQGKVSVTTE
jgi:hypothetical protein